MANLNVRINNKFDTYENWMKSDLILGAGEIAVASIPSGDDTGLTPPAVGVKIGNGEKKFSELNWIQAIAGDVHEWAKASVKPEYEASEIKNLSEYISGEIEDTDTQYQLVKVDDYNYKLQSKSLNGSWADVAGSSFVIPKYDDTALVGRVEAIEGDYLKAADKKEINDKIGTVAEGKTVVKMIEEAQAAATYDDTALAGRVSTLEGEMEQAQSDIEANADAISALSDKVGAVADGKTVVGMIDEAKTAVSGEVSALAAKVGTVPADKTVVGMIAEAQEAATYDDTALAGRVTTVEGVVETLIGEDSGKSARTIANEELAKQLIPENAKEALNELQEIAAWIQSHPDNASAMNEAIVALQNKLSGIDEGTGTVKKYVDDAITALKIGDYALASDLAKLAERVTTLEGEMDQAQADITGINDKIGAVTEGKTVVGMIAEAQAAAEKVATDANSAMDGRVTKVENKLSDVAEGKTVAALIAEAQAAAEKVATDFNTAMDSRVDTLEGEMEQAQADIEANEKAIGDLDDSLAAIAKTGNVNDLVQTEGDVLIFNCGTASTVL